MDRSRLCDAPPASTGSPKIRDASGSRRHFHASLPWCDLVEIHWAHAAQADVTPVAKDEVGIAIICSDPLLRFDDLLELFPALQTRLRGAAAASNIRGAMTASRQFAKVTTKNIALLGDASGSVDALTGLGLSLAFQQAAALGDAMAKGDLSAYAAAHRRIARLPRVMEMLMLSMDRRDWFRRRAICALAAEPAQFSRFHSQCTQGSRRPRRSRYISRWLSGGDSLPRGNFSLSSAILISELRPPRRSSISTRRRATLHSH